MNLQFYAHEKHHAKHAQSIADEFGLNVEREPDKIIADNVVVFSYGDLKKMNDKGKKIIFCDHGTGFYYNESHPSYAGSHTGRENVVLRLSPNHIHAEKEKETLDCPIEIIGMPKLDRFANKYWRVHKGKPTIAISFHFDCRVNNETRSSFSHFERALPWLKEHFKVLGHGHPRILDRIKPYYKKYGIPIVEDFEEVIKRADCYIIDNSSTIYEWCITKKPIVLLNAPFYRRNVEHKGNPRFWRLSDIAPHCNQPEDLVRCVYEAVNNHDLYLPAIESAREEVLGFTDGKCAERAKEAIIKHIQL